MQDAIIKGNGNSRYLKTVAAALSLYPTYEDFLHALVAGNFPIDLNGINEAGWAQLGTALSKNNLLPDTLATSLGLPATATVADALGSLKNLNDDTNAALEEATGWELLLTKTWSNTLAHNTSGAFTYLNEIGSVVANKEYSEIRVEFSGTVSAPSVSGYSNFFGINIGRASGEYCYSISGASGASLSNVSVSSMVDMTLVKKSREPNVTALKYGFVLTSTNDSHLDLKSDNSTSSDNVFRVVYLSKSGQSAIFDLTIKVYGRGAA